MSHLHILVKSAEGRGAYPGVLRYPAGDLGGLLVADHRPLLKGQEDGSDGLHRPLTELLHSWGVGGEGEVGGVVGLGVHGEVVRIHRLVVAVVLLHFLHHATLIRVCQNVNGCAR